MRRSSVAKVILMASRKRKYFVRSEDEVARRRLILTLIAFQRPPLLRSQWVDSIRHPRVDWCKINERIIQLPQGHMRLCFLFRLLQGVES